MQLPSFRKKSTLNEPGGATHPCPNIMFFLQVRCATSSEDLRTAMSSQDKGEKSKSDSVHLSRYKPL